MVEALVLGAVAQVSLLLSGLFATWVAVPSRVTGWLAGFGAGALISAVSFDLIPEAHSLDDLGLTTWLLIGAAVFVGGDWLVDRRFGGAVATPTAGAEPGAESGDGADEDGADEDGAQGALGIVLGSVVDGVPESLIFGIGVAAGNPVSTSFLAAVIVSNIPQALAPSAELAAAGWSRSKLCVMWGSVVVACGLASGLGFLIGSVGGTGDRMAALAAGGLLAMLTDSLMPFAYKRGRNWAGVWTVVGFALAVLPR
jgi:ZIP family zinc transporter